VVALDGLLYAVGDHNFSYGFQSVEFYKPVTNIWTMLENPVRIHWKQAGVVLINKLIIHY